MRPPTTAKEAKIIARKRSPLPRNTVAKKRSSWRAHPVAQHADEPQEGDPGEWQQVQGRNSALVKLDISSSASSALLWCQWCMKSLANGSRSHVRQKASISSGRPKETRM